MKALIVILVILLALGLVVGGKFVSLRNELAARKDEIDRAWLEIDSDLQRRAELIPDLLKIAEGPPKSPAGKSQMDTIQRIASSRTAMLGAQSRQRKIDEYNRMNDLMGGLLVALDSTPRLKDNESFKSLRYQLTETGNSVLEARRRYNEAITNYNKELSLFPKNVVASLAGFSRENAYFKTQVDAQNAPKVPF